MKSFNALFLILVFAVIVGFVSISLWDVPAPTKTIEKTVIIKEKSAL